MAEPEPEPEPRRGTTRPVLTAEVETSSPEETEALAARVAARLEAGDVVPVSGELGCGKTTFVRGACRALGVTQPVTSPTYTIGHRYEGRVPVSHLDLYRFAGVDRGRLGSDSSRTSTDAIAFVEWPEGAEGALPPPRLRVRLRHVDEHSARDPARWRC